MSGRLVGPGGGKIEHTIGGLLGMDVRGPGRPRRGPRILAYSELADLGIPHAVNYSANNDGNYFRRNAWELFEFGGLLFVGGGNGTLGSQGTGVGADNGATCTPRAIDLSDDSIVSVPYASGTATSKEVGHWSVIDGDLFMPSIDDKEGNDADFFRLESGEFVQYRARTNYNHCYRVYKSRRDGRWFAATGFGTVSSTDPVFFSVADFGDWPATSSDAQHIDGRRGLAFLEFGPSESSRLLCVPTVIVYAPDIDIVDAPYTDPSTPEGSGNPKHMYEWDFSADSFLPRTIYPFTGLDRALTHTDKAAASISGATVGMNTTITLMRPTPLSDNEYIGIFGKSTPTSNGQSRFPTPGDFFYRDFGGINGFVKTLIHGGVYRMTLSETKPFAAADGSTFIHCERALPNPEVTGRQWDYQVIGSDIYILTETPDLNCHIYKNGKRIITITDMPTYARCFRIVGPHIYFGLGSEARDSYRENTDTINANSGRVLKAANVL